MSERGHITRAEIFQQPELWPDTVKRVRAAGIAAITDPIITGAGTSAYAAMAIEAAWPGSRAVASTELLLDPRRFVAEGGTVLSIARSGDSPESKAVVDKIPWARHVALTCNPEGALARHPRVEPILLDPRTNDRSLVMTSSFSNMVLGGAALVRGEEVEAALPHMRIDVDALDNEARALASEPPERFVALGSYRLFGAAREASLKVLEMTAGKIAALPETYLGLRHGPMSFLREDTPVLCFLSNNTDLARYENDLLNELRAKKIGRIIPVRTACELPDELRTPAAIVFAQLLAFHWSLSLGLDPDKPSPGGVINRVVQGVRIYA